MKFSRLRVVLLLAVAASAAVVFLSWYVNYKSIHASSQHYAQIRGQSLFHLVQMIRKWNAGHGGVYVPVTDGTPSNPYLDVPDRDITDSLGRDLTKVNPAYMTRQLSELLKGSGVEARLTSLKPLNPVNQPDEWERKALNKFENGSAEELLEVEGDNYRYMAPLYITEECLQCHAVWGYKLGDVRGGLAFSFPVSHTERLIGAQVRTATHNHLIMFFVLLVMSVSLYLSIDFFRGQLRASQERREALEAEVKEDGLTGVLNHKAVVSGLDGELKRAIRSQHKLSVLMIDLDFFKKINDNYGHLVGDEVLKRVAADIKMHLREIDLLGRYGGEEFMAVLPEAGLKNAVKVAERIRYEIEANKFSITLDGEVSDVAVTASFGVAELQRANCQAATDLIELADRALYFAKDHGRNRVSTQLDLG